MTMMKNMFGGALILLYVLLPFALIPVGIVSIAWIAAKTGITFDSTPVDKCNGLDVIDYVCHKR